MRVYHALISNSLRVLGREKGLNVEVLDWLNARGCQIIVRLYDIGVLFGDMIGL